MKLNLFYYNYAHYILFQNIEKFSVIGCKNLYQQYEIISCLWNWIHEFINAKKQHSKETTTIYVSNNCLIEMDEC